MAVLGLNPVAVGTLEEEAYAVQLPVGDVGQIRLNLAGGALVGTLGGTLGGIAVDHGEVGDLLISQLDQVLGALAQTVGGLLIGQSLVAHQTRHVRNKGILALVHGVSDTGGIIQAAPVRMGKQLLENRLRLGSGLCGFKVTQPAVEPVQAEVHTYEEQEDEQEIQGVEDHAAQPGPLRRGSGAAARCLAGA